MPEIERDAETAENGRATGHQEGISDSHPGEPEDLFAKPAGQNSSGPAQNIHDAEHKNPNDALNREEPDHIRKKRKRSIAAAALLLIIGFAGTVYYRREIMPEKLLSRASHHYSLGEYQAALELYRRLEDAGPENTAWLYEMAHSMERNSLDAEAADTYTRLLQISPQDARALERLWGVYQRMGLYEKAMAVYESAHGLIPETPETLHALGVMYENLDQKEKAGESYRKLIDSGTDDPELLLDASRALMRLGQYVEALQGFEIADVFTASGDMRAFHGINAAKDMMGWPTDAEMVIEPGRSIGSVSLGQKSSDLIAAWGKPAKRVAEGEHELWNYGEPLKTPATFVYLEGGEIIEIRTYQKNNRTFDGIGAANFMEPKFERRFHRWVDDTREPPVYRYILKEGGLAFYSGEQPCAVIFAWEYPLSEEVGMQWRSLDPPEETDEQENSDSGIPAADAGAIEIENAQEKSEDERPEENPQ